MGDEAQLVAQVRDLLHRHGVPEDRSEERVHLAMKKLGQDKIKSAMDSKNAWGALKALGSLPKNSDLWIKPDELDCQIKLRAHTKFRTSPSEKRKTAAASSHAKAHIDPKMLQVIPGTFITEDNREVVQIAMEDVAADKAGLAFGTMEAMEAVLIDGSVVQLGDCSVVRRQDHSPADTKIVETKKYNLTVWKDEWTAKWADFVQSPVKKIIEWTPRLLLCKGDRCGQGCTKFHAPVDCDLDQVVSDLWARGWYSNKGKRTSRDKADQFSVLMRIPVFLCRRASTTIWPRWNPL